MLTRNGLSGGVTVKYLSRRSRTAGVTPRTSRSSRIVSNGAFRTRTGGVIWR